MKKDYVILTCLVFFYVVVLPLGVEKFSLTFPWCFASHKTNKKQKKIQVFSINSQWLVMGNSTLTYSIY